MKRDVAYQFYRHLDRACFCCVVRLSIYRPTSQDDGWFGVQVMSTSVERWHSMWRNRVRNAWSVLRGRYDWSGFTVDDADEARSLKDAIDEAVREAFPSVKSELSVSNGPRHD